MKTVSTYEAKTHLSQLIKSVQDGESVIITKAGKPTAVLTHYKPSPNRSPNTLRNKITIAADFDQLPDSFSTHFAT
jgi:prevent-host-death family protein